MIASSNQSASRQSSSSERCYRTLQRHYTYWRAGPHAVHESTSHPTQHDYRPATASLHWRKSILSAAASRALLLLLLQLHNRLSNLSISHSYKHVPRRRRPYWWINKDSIRSSVVNSQLSPTGVIVQYPHFVQQRTHSSTLFHTFLDHRKLRSTPTATHTKHYFRVPTHKKRC